MVLSAELSPLGDGRGDAEAPASSERTALQQQPDAAPSMHPMFAVVFALNYMMGSGYLTLPKAYADAGLYWGIGMTLFMAVGATVSAECILDAMDRAEWVSAARGHPPRGGSFYHLASAAGAPSRQQRANPRPAQLPDLCALFLGAGGSAAYLFMLASFMLGSMWCYAAIFGAAIRTHLGDVLGPNSYAWYVGVFAAVVVPLSLKDLADQKAVQSALAFGRQVMLIAMIVSSALCLAHAGPVEAMPERDSPFSGVAALAPIVAFSFTLHHSVPQIVAPVKAATPFTLNRVFRSAFASAACIYVGFAAPVSLLFGRATRAAANLDWATYHHVANGADPRDRYWVLIASGVAKYIVLYPALNVVATYPLNAITFGDALMATYRSRRGARVGGVNPLPPSRSQTSAFRLLAAIPPLAGAALVSDISAITGVTGCFGLAMCAIVPGLLARAAKRAAPGPTPHASCLNGPAAALGLSLCGAVLTLIALGAAVGVPFLT